MSFGMGPIKKRGSKKKVNWSKYNQKTTKKTKENIKNRSWLPKASKPQKKVTVHSPVMQSGGGSRVGQKTENESIDSAKKAVKSVIKSLAKKEKTPKLSQARLNNTTGGRAGQKTERVKFTPYKMNTKGLDDKTAGHKQRFQQSFRSGLQTGGRSFLKAEKSGAYASKMTDKEKKAVVKSIEKDYNKKAKDGRKAFVAGLTKSDVNVETATKALFGKRANTKKVRKTGAYKAGDVVQEIGSYAIAPEGAITEALGKKVIKAGAKKMLKKEATKTAEKATEKAAKELAKKVVKEETKKAGKAVANKVTKKEAKSAAKKLAEKTSPDVAKKLLKQEAKATSKAIDKKLSTKEAKEAFRIIAYKGVKKGSEKAVTNAGNAAVKEVKEKAVREAIKESGKQVMGSKLKSQAIKRGGDVIANAPLNARYAVSHADETRKENKEAELKQLNRSFKKGKVSQEDYATRKAAIKKKYSSLDMGDVAKDFLLNTGLDVGVGGGIDAVVGKARKIKKANLKRIKKYESQIKGGMTREGKKRAARAAERAVEREARKGFSNVGTKAVKGKRVASAETLSRGKVIKRAFDRIDKLEAAKKISRRQAKQERKALTKAVENQTGRIGFAFRGKNGIEFGRATKRGVEHIDNETFGRNLGIDKRFKGNEASGRISRLKKMTPEQKADMENLKTARRIEAENKEEARNLERLSKAEKTEGKKALTEREAKAHDEELREVDDKRFGKTEEAKAEEARKIEQSKPKTKTAKKRQQKSMKKVHDKYGFNEQARKEIDDAIEDYVKTNDKKKFAETIRAHADDAVVERLDGFDDTTKAAIADVRKRMRRGFYNEKQTNGNPSPFDGGKNFKGYGNSAWNKKEQLEEYGAKLYNKGGKKKRGHIDNDYMELNEMFGEIFPQDIHSPLDQLARMKEVADWGEKNWEKAAREVMSEKEIDNLADDLADEYIEAASAAEPRAGKNIKPKERTSKLAETDKVYDETPAFEDIHPEAKAETSPKAKDATEGAETTPTAEKTPKPSKVSTAKESGLKTPENKTDEMLPRKGITKPSENPITRDIQSHIGNSKKKSGRLEGNKAVVDARRKFVDSLYFTEREAKKWAEVTGDKQAFEELRGSLNAFRQSAEKANYSITERQIDFDGKDVGESVKSIVQDMNSKGTLEDAEAYLYLINHADRLDNAKSKEMGKLIEQYKKIEKDIDTGKLGSEEGENKLIALEEKMDELDDDGIMKIRENKRLFNDKTAKEAREEAAKIAKENPEAVKDAQRIVQYFRNDLDSQVKAGLVSAEQADHFKETYPNYVPAHRADFGDGVSKSIVPNIDALVAKGSGREILPIETQMQMSAHYTHTMGTQNELKQIIARNSGANTKALEELDVDPLEAAAFFEEGSGKIKFFEDGKLKTVDLGPAGKEIIKDLEDQIKNNVAEDWSKGALHALGTVNKAFKALITDYSPVFMIKNFMRDVPEGALQAESTRKYLKELIGLNKGFDSSLKSILTNDDYYKAYLRTGAGHSQLVNSVKILNERELKALKPLEKLQRLNEIAEQMPRVAEFKSALKRMGVTPETATKSQLDRASLAAADVTVNFGRSGSVGRLINKSFVPFFNPAIQGFDKIIRVINRDKSASGMMKLVTKAALLGVAPVAVNEALVGDNPNYKKISDRDKMTNYYIPLDADNPILKVLDLENSIFGSGKSGAKDGEMWLKIPKARILSVLGVIPQKVNGSLTDTGFGDVLAFAKDQVGPVSFMTNNIAAPIFGVGNNETWYGSPIESQSDLKNADGSTKKTYKRYDANTSSISVNIAKQLHKLGVDVSPKKMDYLLDSYTGIIGDITLSATRKSAQRGLFTKGFITDSTMQSDIQTRYYNKLGGEYTSKETRKKMQTWSPRINQLNKAIKGLQNSDTKGKAEKVRDLTKIRNSLMQKAISGKKADDGISDVKKIANIMGAKHAFKMIASDADKKAAKQYGKVDKKFINGVLAMKDISSGRNISNEAKAVALLSSGAGKKAAKAFGLLHKGTNDMETPYQRAKNYFKNGGSVEEYKSMQKAIKGAKIKSDDYTGKAYTLAKMGASDRLYKLYDIKDYKVKLARNMAALGITSKELERHKARAFGGNHPNNAQAYPYVEGLKKSRAEKAVILGAIASWVDRFNKNPYGTVNASRKDAMDKKFRSKYVSGKVSKASAGKGSPEGWVTPHAKGYQIDPITKKRIPNGKTAGSIGERIQLPAGRNLADLLADEKAGKIKKVTIEERLHNAFGSRIGDVKKKKVFLPTTIKEVKKDKKGNVDITFANGEVWRNPPSKKPKDNTKLESSGTGGGRGYRRWGRGWRRWGRGGYGGSGGGRGTATVKNFEPSIRTGSGGSSFSLKPYEKPPYNPKKVTYKKQTLSRPSRSAATTVKSRSIDTNLSRPSENTKIQTSRINTSLPDIGTEKVSTKATYKKINPAVKSVYKSRAKKASAVKEKRAKANVSIKKARDVYGIRRKRK